MYEVREFFNDDNNVNLKEILKCSIYKYYLRRRDNINDSLQENNKCKILDTTSNNKLSRKEVLNVL